MKYDLYDSEMHIFSQREEKEEKSSYLETDVAPIYPILCIFSIFLLANGCPFFESVKK